MIYLKISELAKSLTTLPTLMCIHYSLMDCGCLYACLFACLTLWGLFYTNHGHFSSKTHYCVLMCYPPNFQRYKIKLNPAQY